jgi:hypothetical protein
MNCPEGSAPLLVGGDSAGGGTAVSLILVLKQGAGWTPQGGRCSFNLDLLKITTVVLGM